MFNFRLLLRKLGPAKANAIRRAVFAKSRNISSAVSDVVRSTENTVLPGALGKVREKMIVEGTPLAAKVAEEVARSGSVIENLGKITGKASRTSAAKVGGAAQRLASRLRSFPLVAAPIDIGGAVGKYTLEQLGRAAQESVKGIAGLSKYEHLRAAYAEGKMYVDPTLRRQYSRFLLAKAKHPNRPDVLAIRGGRALTAKLRRVLARGLERPIVSTKVDIPVKRASKSIEILSNKIAEIRTQLKQPGLHSNRQFLLTEQLDKLNKAISNIKGKTGTAADRQLQAATAFFRKTLSERLAKDSPDLASWQAARKVLFNQSTKLQAREVALEAKRLAVTAEPDKFPPMTLAKIKEQLAGVRLEYSTAEQRYIGLEKQISTAIKVAMKEKDVVDAKTARIAALRATRLGGTDVDVGPIAVAGVAGTTAAATGYGKWKEDIKRNRAARIDKKANAALYDYYLRNLKSEFPSEQDWVLEDRAAQRVSMFKQSVDWKRDKEDALRSLKTAFEQEKKQRGKYLGRGIYETKPLEKIKTRKKDLRALLISTPKQLKKFKKK